MLFQLISYVFLSVESSLIRLLSRVSMSNLHKIHGLPFAGGGGVVALNRAFCLCEVYFEYGVLGGGGG